MKADIISRLGQTDVLLPSLIAAGLSANDRAKARLSVLQAAGRHARNAAGAQFDLATECSAAGIDPGAMETLVSGASAATDERVTAPGLKELGDAIWDDVITMIGAVKAGDAAGGDAAFERLSAIRRAVTLGSSDAIELQQIAKLTGVSEDAGDSLHRLIMDLHKSLNRLAAEHAEEVVAGAHVYGLLPEDRPTVEAFMRGVESTHGLKFSHPGLATTAMRSPARLTIQNDLGETEAHVVVIAVETGAVTITYTDIHRARARFFTELLREFPVQWSGLERKSSQSLGDNEGFYLVTGRYLSNDDERRNGFIERVGASLVFLIDWNKARKVLRTFVSNKDAIRVLESAARNRFGHRGFLELGGSELVASAVHHAAPTRIGFGERLDHALGREAAADFLKAVLRVSAEALLEGSSIRLARDRIEADLIRHLERVDTAPMAVVVRQAGLAREIAAAIAHCVAEQQAHRRFDRATLAKMARRIEEKADRIAIEARREIERLDAHRIIERLVDRVEEAIDQLEQAAFIASLAPDELAPELLESLAKLCAAAVSATEAVAAGVSAGAEVSEGQRVDLEDALAAVARLIEIEHEADAAERAVTTLVLSGDFDLKTALVALELARALERATDRLAGFGHLLREHLLARLSA
jgi:uncharacterized protein Yka (UPF0111/DUF47 family)